MTKVLVTGATGLLGRAVVDRLRAAGLDVTGTAFTRAANDIKKVDLTDEAATEALIRELRPDAIIHSAAERRPDVVEKDPDAAHALNVEVPAHLAKLCAELEPSPLLINISTDYVFDGTKPPYKVNDAPNPLNAYGVSKLEGEMAVTKHGKAGSSTSLRVPVLYGRTAAGQNDESAVNILLDAIRVPADAGKKKKMDAYAVRYPTNVDDVARVLSDLVTRYTSSLQSDSPFQVPAILHFSATEAMTKYDMSMIFTRLINAAGGQATTEHLEPEYEVDPLAATSRPRHCKLDVSVLQELGISTDFVPFEDWWRSYVDELEARRREEEEGRARREEEARQRREAEEAAERKRIEAERAAEQQRIAEEAERKRKEEEAAAERRRIEEEEAVNARRAKEEEEAAARRKEAEQEARELEASATVASTMSDDQDKDAPSESAAPQATPVETSEDQASGTEAPAQVKAGDTPAFEEGSERTTRGRPNEVASPDPSLSSLRPLRPTPPVTLASREGSISADEGEPSLGPDTTIETAASSTITAVPDVAPSDSTVATGAPASSTANPLPVADASINASTANRQDQVRQRQRPPEAPGFFPESLALNQADAIGGLAAPSTPGPRSSSNGADGNDGDSDEYGQPSPRVRALSAADEVDAQDGGASMAGSRDMEPGADAQSGTSGPFKAGYGEVPFAPGQRPRPSASQSSWPDDAQQPSGVARAGGSSSTDKPAPPKLQFEIKVGDPQKVGDPVTAHIVYTVRTKTNATFFRAQTFSVLRRYSDFRWLHAALVANNPGTFVPPVPEKVKIGRFAPDLVEARRHGLEICINKIAAHPILQMDEDFKLFLESVNFNADVKLRDMRKGPVPTPEQRTYFGWHTSLNGPKFHESDDWFDHQKAYLDNLEAQVKQVVKAASQLAVQRRELAHAVSEYSLMLVNLSGSSLSRSMSTCFAGLAELERRVHELNEAQSDADIRIIGSVMYEYERLVGSIRKAFATRVDAWTASFKADEEARKVQAKHEKFKKDHRGTGGSHMEHRLQLSLQDVADAESRALTLKRDFDAITARCKEEMSRFEREKVEDVRGALVRWLDGLIGGQEEVVREWERYAALLARQTGTNPDPDAVVPPPAPAPASASASASASGPPPAATTTVPSPESDKPTGTDGAAEDAKASSSSSAPDAVNGSQDGAPTAPSASEDARPAADAGAGGAEGGGDDAVQEGNADEGSTAKVPSSNEKGDEGPEGGADVVVGTKAGEDGPSPDAGKTDDTREDATAPSVGAAAAAAGGGSGEAEATAQGTTGATSARAASKSGADEA